MSKLYLSVDLEGAAGITSPNECDPNADREAYNRAVEYLCKEVSVVVNTAFDCGVKAIVVNDAHMTMTNLRPELLPAGVELLKGKPKTCAMASGLDETFDAALFIGYHAKAGTPDAILNHTFHSKIFDVTVNGISYGEFGINALYAGNCFNVPVILTSGDNALCLEAKQLLPNIAAIKTKHALSATAAQNQASASLLNQYQTVCQSIFQNADQWQKNCLKLEPPYILEITFIHSLCAETALMMPGFSRTSGRSIAYKTDDFKILYQALQTAYALQAYATHIA